jgi:hypothetical protein
MIYEFIEFQKMIQNNQLESCYEILNHTLLVSKIQTRARLKAGIHFQDEAENL